MTILDQRKPPYDHPLQREVDAFYRQHGPCCAGCDHWRFLDAVFGECRKSAPVSGYERWLSFGMRPCGFIPEPGHIITKREHHCGDFTDTYDWG